MRFIYTQKRGLGLSNYSTPLLFIVVRIPSQEYEWSCICVLEVSVSGHVFVC